MTHIKGMPPINHRLLEDTDIEGQRYCKGSTPQQIAKNMNRCDVADAVLPFVLRAPLGRMLAAKVALAGRAAVLADLDGATVVAVGAVGACQSRVAHHHAVIADAVVGEGLVGAVHAGVAAKGWKDIGGGRSGGGTIVLTGTHSLSWRRALPSSSGGAT